ncbi:copper amine oxidase N-terminal domain-containing protein [Paenibacillus agilis]|nr:copper amine oxidase N-terminal domain-containing protein [Paenibacillus agilis]
MSHFRWKRTVAMALVALQCAAVVPVASALEQREMIDVTQVQTVESQTVDGYQSPIDGQDLNGTEQTSDNGTTTEGGSTSGESVNPNVDGSTSSETGQPTDETTGDPNATDGSSIENPNTTEPKTKEHNIDTTIYGSDVLVILANSNVIVHNNVTYYSKEPITVKKGVSYISVRGLVERFGFQLDFDNTTKETIIRQGDRELRYKDKSNVYRVNGESTKMSGASYLQNNTFMVPLTSALQAMQIKYEWEQQTKRIIVQMSAAPVAKFKVTPEHIFAGQTEVVVENQSFHPRGLQIIDYEWTGLESFYSVEGQYTISLRVLDEKGVWSEPYSVTINVQPPNMPPVVDFTTNKTEYKMGELIEYHNESYDDEDAIEKVEWTNNKQAFFTPGEQQVTLKVTDKHGLSAEITKSVTITNETLYTFDEFNKIYTQVGYVYPIDGSTILGMKELTPQLRHGQRTLYRSNSPESIVQDGILYKDHIAGGTRILMHHKNAKSTDIKLYVVVKNISDEDAVVRVERAGAAGPSLHPQQTGKAAAQRYFQSFREHGIISEQTLKPKESALLMPEMSSRAIKPQQVYTMYADFLGDNNLEYKIIALDASKDIWKELPNLQVLPSDGTHIRGSFNNADRTLTVSELVGEEPSRIVFGDNKSDKTIGGWDTTSNTDVNNAGNYGVLYRVVLDRVAPNTLIGVNARGGQYSGSILVNGQEIGLPINGILKGKDEAVPIYRTGDREEKVEIWFTPAAASTMPLNVFMTQLPPKRT